MATRRRIGVSIATTEAARRQLMQPVPCWERVWVTSPIAPNIKIYKWVKTDKTQQFDDDEGGMDEPLAPLPDEPEVVEGEEDLEQDEAKNLENAQPKDLADVETNPDEPTSKLPSPKPTLSTLPPPDLEEIQEDALDASLKPIEPTLIEENVDDDDDDAKKVDSVNVLDLDMSVLGPDGLQLEDAHDLSQLAPGDSLMGPSLMDESSDPFDATS